MEKPSCPTDPDGLSAGLSSPFCPVSCQSQPGAGQLAVRMELRQPQPERVSLDPSMPPCQPLPLAELGSASEEGSQGQAVCSAPGLSLVLSSRSNLRAAVPGRQGSATRL